MNDTKTHTWTKDEMILILSKRDDQVAKALLKLYEFQTANEQDAEETLYRNNVGFNGVDGPFLSNVAQFYNKHGYLSPKQLFRVRKALRKYAGQLAKIANGEITAPSNPRTWR